MSPTLSVNAEKCGPNMDASRERSPLEFGTVSAAVGLQSWDLPSGFWGGRCFFHGFAHAHTLCQEPPQLAQMPSFLRCPRDGKGLIALGCFGPPTVFSFETEGIWRQYISHSTLKGALSSFICSICKTFFPKTYPLIVTMLPHIALACLVHFASTHFG